MAINALDQLIRADQSSSATPRRAPSQPDQRFSSLLDAQAARARVERPQQPQRSTEATRREDDAAAKPAHAERTEQDERTGRSERTEQGRDDARPRKAERKNADKGAVSKSDKNAKGSAENSTDSDTAQAADAPLKGDVAKPVDEKLATGEAAAKIEGAAPTAPVANEADPLLPLAVVTADAQVPVAVAIALVVEIQAPAEAAEIEKTAAAAIEAAVPVQADASQEAAKAAKPQAETSPDAAKANELRVGAQTAKEAAALAQIALPTATLAEAAKKSEPATEEFADFMLRNAAMTASASTDAGKDAAKADAADAAKDIAKEGKLIVTVSQPAPVAAPVAAVTAFAVQSVVSNDNISLEAGNAAKIALESDDARPVAKTAEPTNLFAQNLEAARGTQAASETKAAPRMPVVPPHEQVAVNIRKAVDEGIDRISIHLNPADLGRIDIKIDMRADGTLRAAFAADRQQTLELLKNDSRQLETALSDAGLRADAGGLNFSLRGDNRENAQAFRDMGNQFAKRGDDTQTEDTAAPAATTTYVRRRAGNGRVDLNA